MLRRCLVIALAACGGGHGAPDAAPPACALGPIAAGDPDGHPQPLGAGPTEARAGRVRAADLPSVPSGLVTWKAGDFVLANDRVALVIEDAGDSDLYDPWGGRPVGLARVAGGKMIEPSNFGEVFVLTGRSTVMTDSVSVIADGSDGKAAVIRARGKLHPLPFFEKVVGGLFRDAYDGVDAAIDYELAPGSDHVDIRMRYASADEHTVPSVLHALMYTQRTPTFVPGKGFTDTLTSAPYVGLIDDSATSWAYVPADGAFGGALSVAGFVGAFADGFALPACTETARLHAQLVIGGPGLDGLGQAMARLRGEAQREVTGTITRAGVPQAGVRVHAADATGYLTRATTDSAGRYTLHVPQAAQLTLTAFRRGDGVATTTDGALSALAALPNGGAKRSPVLPGGGAGLAIALPAAGAKRSPGLPNGGAGLAIAPLNGGAKRSPGLPNGGAGLAIAPLNGGAKPDDGAGVAIALPAAGAKRSPGLPDGSAGLAIALPAAGAKRSPALPEGGAGLAIALPAAGAIHVTASEGATRVPVRVQVVPAEGQAIPDVPASFGETAYASGRLHVAYATAGEVTLTAPPGRWEVIVSRGYEYELARQTVTVTAGATTQVDAAMERSVATPGALCGDFHIHTWRSNDSGDQALTKVAQAVADGVELPVRSDHEWVGDFGSEIAALGVQAFAAAIGSIELTSFEVWGHMGVFPLTADASAVNAGAPRWQAFPTPEHPDTKLETLSPPAVFDAVRARPEAPLVIINHPRGGANYFDYVGFDPATGLAKSAADWDTRFTLVEVFNDSGWQANRMRNVEDWLGLLRAGRKVFAVGSSDSHGIATSPVGYPRTCIAVGTDDPRAATANGVRDPLAAGHAAVSGGIYVATRLGDTGPGDTTTGAGSPQQLDVTVQAASWVDVTSVEIIVDGVTVDTIPVMPGDAGPGAVRWHKQVPIQVRATGGFVIAAAYGTQPLEPVHPGRIPFGVTEPIFVNP